MIIIASVVFATLGVLAGLAVGLFLKQRELRSRVNATKNATQQLLGRTEIRCNQLLLKAKQDARKMGVGVDEIRGYREKFRRERSNISHIERQLEKRAHELKQRDGRLSERSSAFDVMRSQLEQDLADQKHETQQARDRYMENTARIAGLTEAEARQEVLAEAEATMKVEITQRYRRADKEAKDTADAEAREVLAHTIQRMASDAIAEFAVTTIRLPNEDMKGRLIGREGRNIKALEAATGVNLIVNNEAPDEVILSSFDPLRREVARGVIERLMKDGRIQPERIERTVEKVEQEIDEDVRAAGEDAVYEVGVHGLPAELTEIMGKLKFRYSYGSNVLRHSVEVGLLAASIAAEIGADTTACRMAGFLHDIGKAFTPEIDQPHAEIGADLVKKHRFSKNIELAIREHHDSELTTTESFVVAAADAVSAARPGVRNDNVERYIQRMEELESIVLEFKGVQKCYAMQSGHEVRVLVNPNGVKDEDTAVLARDIAKKVQHDLTFPGEIRIQVIREMRAEAIAS